MADGIKPQAKTSAGFPNPAEVKKITTHRLLARYLCAAPPTPPDCSAKKTHITRVPASPPRPTCALRLKGIPADSANPTLASPCYPNH
jgi:hypothetical protein